MTDGYAFQKITRRRLSLTRRLVVYDLETTGLDVEHDRIIQIAGEIWEPNDPDPWSFDFLINPGIPIPAEIVDLTGISNADVITKPKFKDLAADLIKIFLDADIAGWGILKFDSKMLDEEFKRAGMDFGLQNRKILDSRVLWRSREPKNLASAADFYCGLKDNGQAHRADWDAHATARILEEQLTRYEDLPLTVDALAVAMRPTYATWVDVDGKLFWRDGEAAFSFGKFKGYTLRALSQGDTGRSYLRWIVDAERGFSREVVEMCRGALAGTYPKKAAL